MRKQESQTIEAQTHNSRLSAELEVVDSKRQRRDNEATELQVIPAWPLRWPFCGAQNDPSLSVDCQGLTTDTVPVIIVSS